MNLCKRLWIFAENISKKIGKNIHKNLSTYEVNTVENFLIMLNNLLQMHLKLLQKKQLIGNKIADKITKVSKGSPENSSGMTESETKKQRNTKKYI